MPLVDKLNNFRNSVNEASTFIALAFQQDAGGNYILPQNQRDFITDSAFLKIFISWETFLEQSFICYMLGEPSVTGIIITRYVQPTNDSHASKILVGTQKYVDWSNPEVVKRLASLYFSPGSPHDFIIGSVMADLFDLKTIRNAAAHLATTTQPQLDSLSTRKLRRPCNNVKVSDFIFSIDPSSLVNDTILQSYLNILDVAAESISNG